MPQVFGQEIGLLIEGLLYRRWRRKVTLQRREASAGSSSPFGLRFRLAFRLPNLRVYELDHFLMRAERPVEAARFHVGQALRQSSIDSPSLRRSVFVVSGCKLRSVDYYLGSQDDPSALHRRFH